ncbi:MAG: nucleotidyltransferase family protein [Anaerolineales bacterium]|nr:nucleotidyltransferase family protein [Anaerolineales bacterium]
MIHQDLSALRVEEKLLLETLRQHITGDNQQTLEQLVSEPSIDYAYLLQVASRNSVGLLLLDGLAPFQIPLLQTFVPKYNFVQRRNLVLAGELLKLIRHFNEQQISAIPLKGTMLAIEYYPSLPLREFNDIDVLVQRQQVPHIKAVMNHLGFTLDERQQAIPEKKYLRTRYHYRFTSPDNLYDVEVHWKLAYQYLGKISEAALIWQHAELMSIYDTPVLQPMVEDLLLYLCTHGGRHGWSRLSWVCDVAFVIQKHPDIRWDYVLQQAHRTNATRLVLLGVAITSRLFQIALPDLIQTKINQDKHIEPLLQMVYQNIFSPAEGQTLLLGQYLFQLKMQPDFITRLRLIRYILSRRLQPTSKDQEAIHLPKVLYPLHYVLRPFRLIRYYGKDVYYNLLNRNKAR